MRYPTMSGLKVDAAGVVGSGQAEEVKNEPKPPAQPVAAAQPSKPAASNVVEHGNKPPSLDLAGV